MIGRVMFETSVYDSIAEQYESRIIRPQEDYGIFLKTYDVTPPKAKIYRVQLEGADGSLDFTEWAGRGNVLYETRVVTVELRDLNDKSSKIRNAMLGRKTKITFSDAPDWYYDGRCDEIQSATRKHVTDMTLKFTCKPYRFAHQMTYVSKTVSTSERFALRALRAPVVPIINVQGTGTVSATITVNGVEYQLVAGDNTNVPVKVTDTAQYRTVVNTGSNDITVTFRWRDGEF